MTANKLIQIPLDLRHRQAVPFPCRHGAERAGVLAAVRQHDVGNHGHSLSVPQFRHRILMQKELVSGAGELR
jgi:hypothetical protein